MSKRVLIAASTMSHIRNFHLPYIRALRERGYTVSVMAAGESADYPVPFRKSVFSPKNLLNILRIRRILKKERFDAVLVHTSLAAFLVRMAAKTMRRRPVVINTVHGYLFSDGKGLRNRLMLLCEKMCRRVTDYLFVMNREDKAIAEKYRLAKTPPVFFYGMGLPAAIRPFGKRYSLFVYGRVQPPQGSAFSDRTFAGASRAYQTVSSRTGRRVY